MRTRMYERDAVLAAVRRLLDAAYAGHGGMVFVVAAAGLGKTSVLDAAVQEAWTRFDVRIGRADAVEATLPYGLIGQALGEDAEPADGERVDDLPAASRYYATLRRVRRQAADRPLLLAFDDLHWSDPDSLALVHLLCRRAPELPVAVVATARPWPDAALRMAEQLAAHALADIQRLPPLSDRAARAVLRDRFGELGREAVERAVAACDGNPLLLELAAPNPHAEAADAGAAPGEPARRLLLARFSAADPATQAYVRAASVLGVQFRPAIAAALAELPAERAVGIVEDLVRADLLREDDQGGLRFRHALLRQAVYDDLPAPTRAYLHQRAFRTLLTAGVAAGEAAEHAVAADLAGDRQAIATLADAGRAALHAGAVQAAGRHLRAAVRLAGDDAATAELRIDLARALLAGGASQDAAAVLDRLLTSPELPVQTRLTGATAARAGGLQHRRDTAGRRAVRRGRPDRRHRPPRRGRPRAARPRVAELGPARPAGGAAGGRPGAPADLRCGALPAGLRRRRLGAVRLADRRSGRAAGRRGGRRCRPPAGVGRRHRELGLRPGGRTRRHRRLGRTFPARRTAVRRRAARGRTTRPAVPAVPRRTVACGHALPTGPAGRGGGHGRAGLRRRRVAAGRPPAGPGGEGTGPGRVRAAGRGHPVRRPGRRHRLVPVGRLPAPAARGARVPPGGDRRGLRLLRPAGAAGRPVRPGRPVADPVGGRRPRRVPGRQSSRRRRAAGRPAGRLPAAQPVAQGDRGRRARRAGRHMAGTSTSRRPASPRRYACCGTSRCRWHSAGR